MVPDHYRHLAVTTGRLHPDPGVERARIFDAVTQAFPHGRSALVPIAWDLVPGTRHYDMNVAHMRQVLARDILEWCCGGTPQTMMITGDDDYECVVVTTALRAVDVVEQVYDWPCGVLIYEPSLCWLCDVRMAGSAYLGSRPTRANAEP